MNTTDSQNRLVTCGVVAGRLFVTTFTVLGEGRDGYDARRDAVSSLAEGRRGWIQRTNFVVTGALYLATAAGLARQPRKVVGSGATPVLLAAAGAGLVGSGVFLTDAIGGLSDAPASGDRQRSREGLLHDLCAIPIFVGIPVAAAASGRGFAKQGYSGWACYSRASALGMATTFVLFGAAFVDAPGLVAWGGLFQRVSIAAGFGWLTALSMRARRMLVSRAEPRPARRARSPWCGD